MTQFSSVVESMLVVAGISAEHAATLAPLLFLHRQSSRCFRWRADGWEFGGGMLLANKAMRAAGYAGETINRAMNAIETAAAKCRETSGVPTSGSGNRPLEVR